MDVLARASMKDAAKCDTHCELQISVNHQISERIWRCRDFPAARLFQCLLTTPSTPRDFASPQSCDTKKRTEGCVLYTAAMFYFLLCSLGGARIARYRMGVERVLFIVFSSPENGFL